MISFRVSIPKTEERVVDLKSAMVLEKDEQVKEYQKEDFQKTSDHIIELNAEIEGFEKQIKSVKGATLTYESFLELFDNMSLRLTKTDKMEDLNTLLQKVFLNFTVSKKLVEGYTLNEPFASLERLETPNVSDGAR